MHRLILLLVLFLLPSATLLAQTPPPRSVSPSPLWLQSASPIGFDSVRSNGLTPSAATAQLTCRQSFADPPVSLAPADSPWLNLQVPRTTMFSLVRARSLPQAIVFQANRDGDPISGPDTDAAAQRITVPANLGELQGSLFYNLAAGSASPGDQLTVELYPVDRFTPDDRISTITTVDLNQAPTNSWTNLDWEVFEPGLIAQLAALGEFVVAFRLTAGSPSSSTTLWLDDLTANICAGGGNLSGQVRVGTATAAKARVTVVRSGPLGRDLVTTAETDANGNYNLSGMPALEAGEQYQIWYLSATQPTNRPPGRLGYWAGPVVSATGPGIVATNLNLDIADITLTSPASYAEVVVTDSRPVALRWQGRAPNNERQRLCLYDPAQLDPISGAPVVACGSFLEPGRDELVFNFAPSSFAGIPNLSLIYGRSYHWYIEVTDGNQPPVSFGTSFAERILIPLEAEPPPPDPAPEPDLRPFAPAPSGTGWALLIYMAADNAIGDARRAPLTARPTGQLAELPALATAHPQVGLLSWVDSFGPGGAQVCVYPAGAPADCRVRAEPNSADPASLAGLISLGRERFVNRPLALLIVAPGQATGMLALDETTNDGVTAMDLDGLSQAYQAAGLDANQRLDLVIYQAPLLGSVDVLRASAPYARMLVAAPGQIWQLDPYAQLIAALAERPSAEQAARASVAAFEARVSELTGPPRAVSLAAYDLGRVAALGTAIDQLANELTTALTVNQATARPLLVEARAATQSYDSAGDRRLITGPAALPPNANDAQLDLADLTIQLLATPGLPEATQNAATAVRDLLADPQRSPVITSSLRSGLGVSGEALDLSRASGLAIFFPSGDRFGGQATLTDAYLFGPEVALSTDQPWRAMVRAFVASTIAEGPGGITDGAGGPGFRPVAGGFVNQTTPTYVPLVRR
ncbi:MAG: clostripain-related cysteine peptidase [Oscillochloridaceae bacterium umkhey_bin13]